jgi:hypothetical protein
VLKWKRSNLHYRDAIIRSVLFEASIAFTFRSHTHGVLESFEHTRAAEVVEGNHKDDSVDEHGD